MSGSAGDSPYGIDRRQLLRGGAGLLAGGYAAMIAGCGGTSTPSAGAALKPPRVPTGTLTFSTNAEPRSLNPALTGDLSDFGVMTHTVFDTLTVLAPDGTTVVPHLATDWDVSPDGRRWSFSLRDDVVYHDGARFDARVARDSLRYTQPTFWGTVGLPPADGGRIEAPDPRTLRFVLDRPFPDLARNCAVLAIFAPAQLAAGDADAVGKAIAAKPIGSGPFRFVSYRRGAGMTFEGNADHWGPGPYLKRLSAQILPNASARLSALRTGGIDVQPLVASQQAQTLAGDRSVVVAERTGVNSTLLVFSTGKPPFDDARVRQAAAYALDRKAIVEGIALGRAKLSDTILPPGMYGIAEPQTTYDHDPERARSLLAEAGANGPSVRLIMSGGLVKNGEDVIQAVGAQLEDVGFRVDVQVLDVSTAITQAFGPQAKRPEAQLIDFSSLNGGPFLYTSGGPALFADYAPADYQALLDAVKTTPDGDARLAKLAQIQEHVARNVPFLPVCVPDDIDAYRTNVHGYPGKARSNLLNVGTTYVAA